MELIKNISVRDLTHLKECMHSCEQTKGLTVLEHGEQVSDYFLDLYEHVISGKSLKHEWRLPKWIFDSALWSRLMPLDIITEYHWFHDCGKPFCRVTDAEGKAHFPDHAAVSADIWLRLGLNEKVAKLMRHDMDIHLLKANGLDDFVSMPEAATLLLTGLSEIHANASMFGGTESVSFKMKYKHIERRGKAIVSLLNKGACHEQ
jgi:hypothetical protein